jgi:hypothetical protein
MTKRNAAIHASRCLRLQLVFRELFVDFVPVLNSFFNRTPLEIHPSDFDKTCRITHVAPSRMLLLPAPSSPQGRDDNRAA